jgi:quercetin dioxygenase-like cupin family protein
MKYSLMAICVIVLTPGAVWSQSAAAKSPSTPSIQPSTSRPFSWDTSHSKWVDDPSVPGMSYKPVTGDPEKGRSVRYVKFEPGASIGWHWHPHPEIVYGESGTLQYRVKKTGEAIQVGSGSYGTVPDHVIHKATCISEEPCIFFVENMFPNARHMVDENGKDLPPAAPKPAPKK